MSGISSQNLRVAFIVIKMGSETSAFPGSSGRDRSGSFDPEHDCCFAVATAKMSLWLKGSVIPRSVCFRPDSQVLVEIRCAT